MNPPRVYMCSPSWTCLPPSSLYHPFGSSQCTSPKHPVSCTEPGLVIRFLYDIIHVSMPFSQIIPPFPSPGVQKPVLYICVSFAVSHRGLSLPPFWIPYMCVSILYWCFHFWLTSLCIIGSSFIHLIRTDSNVFFNGWVILHCVYVPQLSYPFICWWTSRALIFCWEKIKEKRQIKTPGGMWIWFKKKRKRFFSPPST